MSRERDTDPLIRPGSGYSPSYGIQGSSESYDRPPSSSGGKSILESIKGNQERVWAVAAFSLIACMASFLVGMMLGYSSLTLLELKYIYDHEKSIRYCTSEHGIEDGSIQQSLFGAFGALGALFGGPVAWPISDFFGRKVALMLGGVPTLIGWVFIVLAHFPAAEGGFISMILIGRFLTGFGGGWFIFCVSLYIAEIASAKLRGLFGNCNQLFITIGIFVSYLLGLAGDPPKYDYDICTAQFQYYYAALVPIVVVVIFEVLALFIPETPRWLYAHGKDLKANRVLELLRGSLANNMKEIDGIKKTIEKDRNMTLFLRFAAFGKRSILIPFVLILFLMFFQQFSGINAAIFYAGSIFQQAQVANPQLINVLSIGLVQIIATLVSVLFVDLLGRKILLMFSSSFMVISSLLMGAHFLVLNVICHGCIGVCNLNTSNITYCNQNCTPEYVKTLADVCQSTNFSGLAITAMIVFIIAFSFGWGPIPWTSMSELMPLKVRGLAASIASLVNWTFATIITAFFQSYAKGVTPKAAWWSFAFISAIGFVFVLLFLPETKGHQLEEIEEHFEEGHILALSCSRRPARDKPRT